MVRLSYTVCQSFPNYFPVFITTIPDIFTNIYGESTGIMGLNYLPLGLGMAFASYVNSKTMDKIYMYLKAKNNGATEPEYRVREYHGRLSFLKFGA